MKTLKKLLLMTMILASSMTTLLADSGNFGPNSSLKWVDSVSYFPPKSTYIEAWDPDQRSSIWRQTEACLGATQGASSTYCSVGEWQTGKTSATASKSRWAGGTAYTYAWWGWQ